MLRLLAGVAEEIGQAVDFYDSRRNGLGREFLEGLFHGYEEIEAHPLRYPRVGLRGTHREYHFYLLDRFPYKIVYQPTVNGIDIIAVAHTSRRPGYWTKRA